MAEKTQEKAGTVMKLAFWAAISDDNEIIVAYSTDDGNDGDAARTECNQYINDALLNDRAALRLVPLYTAQPAERVSVPDAKSYGVIANAFDDAYTEGWNACREAMLAASPQPEAEG